MAIRALSKLQIPSQHRPLFFFFLRPFCSSTLSALCRVLSDHRSPSHDLASALQPFAGLLTSSLLEDSLKRVRHLPSSAHRLFLFASSLPGLVPSPLSHRILLHILASSRNFPLFWAHLYDLHQQHQQEQKRADDEGLCPLSSSVFHAVFFAYSKANLPADAVRAFNKMPEYGVPATLEDLHVLLYALCKHKHVGQAQEFFRGNGAGFEVTEKTYGILMQGWARVGKSEDAIKLFDEMRERGFIDVAAYNALMAALCTGGEIDEAGRRLKEMRAVHGLEPDVGSYAVFIRAYCDVKDLRSALRMLENARRKGLVPNVFTYNCVIRLLCKEAEKADEAYELLDEMVERGLEPDVWSYNRILELHCKLREVNKALRLLKRMDDDGCLLDQHTYNMLLKMLIGVGRLDRAEEVWDGMEKRGFHPSASSYAVMIHGLCRKKGWAKEASRYFEVMVDEGVPPYSSTCKLLRSELLRLGFNEKVVVLADRMRRSSSHTIQELSSVMESGKEVKKCDIQRTGRQEGIQQQENEMLSSDHEDLNIPLIAAA